jgi:HAMP domain-containing protein
MKKLTRVAPAALVALALVCANANARQSTRADAERAAVERAVRQEMSRKTRDHDRLTEFAVGDLKLDPAGWALVLIEPAGNTSDPATLLLRKRRGRWRVLVLGTSLYGTGRQYNVPRRLWKSWGLG